MDENHILIPILNEDVTIFSAVVPKDFADQLELEAIHFVDRFERHPSGYAMDPSNKLEQAKSFIIQNALQFWLMYNEDRDYLPPEVN